MLTTSLKTPPSTAIQSAGALLSVANPKSFVARQGSVQDIKSATAKPEPYLLHLRNEGLSQAAIAQQLGGVSRATISRRLKALGQPQHRGISPYNKRKMEERRAAFVQLRRKGEKCGSIGFDFNIRSSSLVSRELIKAGLRSRTPSVRALPKEVHDKIIALNKPDRSGKPRKSPKEIAAKLKIKIATVYRHLWNAKKPENAN
jgi:hypothetical protein